MGEVPFLSFFLSAIPCFQFRMQESQVRGSVLSFSTDVLDELGLLTFGSECQLQSII